LAGVPSNYRILFLQGGASLQFSMVPMNLLQPGTTADYVDTGTWAVKAIEEARRVGTVNVTGSTKAEKYTRIPAQAELGLTAGSSFVHITTNNTIEGTEWKTVPDTGDAPLVADASSDILSGPIDISRFGLIYAGAQKNLGPSGVVLVIIREDLLELAPKTLPSMLQYRIHAKERSLYNTPNTFGVYLMGEVFRWIQAEGGLDAMARNSAEKARMIYDAVDSSDFWQGTADAGSRSLMNVCFRSPSEEQDAAFCAAATREGLDGLKGHRAVGGMRASIYNACPRAAVEALVEFMKEFERRA
jgi:phosphoserine aminotransferase